MFCATFQAHKIQKYKGGAQSGAGWCCCRHHPRRETGSPASGTPVAGAGRRPGRGEAAGSLSLLRVEGADERSGSSETWRAVLGRLGLCPGEIILRSRRRAPGESSGKEIRRSDCNALASTRERCILAGVREDIEGPCREPCRPASGRA